MGGRVRVRIGEAAGDLAVSWRPGRGGPGVILVHGMGASRHIFRRLLADPGLLPGPAAALDLPGFGDSFALPRRQVLEDYVAAVTAVADAAGWRRPLLVGHSFGGMVAARALADRPGRFAGAVLISPAGFIEPENVFEPSPREWWNRVLIWWTGTAWMGARIVRFLGVDPHQLDPADRRALQEGWRRAREMARMGRFYRTPDLLEQVLASGRPVVVLHGTADPIFPWPAMARRLEGRLDLIPLPGLGHLPFLQDPDRFDPPFGQAVRTLARRV
ncbi:AB hydrolase-1 domain-containing protein [Candidatus Hydrogenisulfobacillus filiaventi]|uniref:AB hydrolase-1 domain-containing protein n=1 Tax=Candidatus Hydrogenisulfobacillus filiaventi TaxID=2707344 RepID=A0A6F8ZJ97_9FIRM|nr:alpha/beta hydrolase [Bacillota bacterium]CAB1129734.1 AB hydrolase-1 domain-containing protein [Candidatus Hydrogenisulfobacillus filiaventi]